MRKGEGKECWIRGEERRKRWEGVNREVLQLYALYKKPYFYYKSYENLYQVLQVTWATAEEFKHKYHHSTEPLWRKESFVAVGIVTCAAYMYSYAQAIKGELLHTSNQR